MVVCLSLALEQSEVGNALRHTVEMGERRSVESHYSLTTVDSKTRRNYCVFRL